MKKYSQNNEQEYILKYFENQKGVFLDIGAYDGIDLSNTRALMELGWSGLCFEPHPEIFERLVTNCKDFDNIYTVPLAVGVSNGVFKLNANDTYYSTLIDSEKERFKNTQKFTEIECTVIDFATVKNSSPFRNFDFISIDCEGLDYQILTQIDLNDVGCDMLCIETNGIETEKYIQYCKNFGMRLLHQNAENIIMAR